jgi:hypothetical protein
MRFVSTPIQFIDSGTKLLRNIEDRIQMLDNLVELIVFTPRGDFEADLDFGFEYWNHEFSNVHYREFNASQGTKTSSLYNEITKKECEDSIKQSLAAYEPMLKNVTVSSELDAASQRQRRKRRVASKYAVNVIVEGGIDDGLGVLRPYRKVVVFLVEPTVKRQI